MLRLSPQGLFQYQILQGWVLKLTLYYDDIMLDMLVNFIIQACQAWAKAPPK